MAQIPSEYGSERKRYEMFVGALADLSPGERVAVGVSLLDESHVLTAEKTDYETVFVRVTDPEWDPLVAEEITVGECELAEAVADAMATAFDRYLRLRAARADPVDVRVEELPSLEH